MTSCKFILLNILVCGLAFSFVYFTPDLQKKFLGNEYLAKILTTLHMQHESLAGILSSGAPASLKSTESGDRDTSQPSESGSRETESEDNGGEEQPQRLEEEEALPVYPAYSELDTYMLSMMTSEDEEEARSIGRCQLIQTLFMYNLSVTN